jgi:hypothetical protein
MKKRFLLLITTSFSLAIISGCDKTTAPTAPQATTPNTVSQTEMVTIKGVVQDQFNQPVAGADITVREDKNILAQTKSNSSGEFSVQVPKVFGDSYFVEAKKDSSDGTMENSILVNAGQEADFTGDYKLRKTEVPAKPVPAV